MTCQTKRLNFDASTLNGLSPALIASLHENNDGGAVKRLNAESETRHHGRITMPVRQFQWHHRSAHYRCADRCEERRD